jgi:hypothetical protein
MLGMQDIILDRISFGGVKELEEIYSDSTLAVLSRQEDGISRTIDELSPKFVRSKEDIACRPCQTPSYWS